MPGDNAWLMSALDPLRDLDEATSRQVLEIDSEVCDYAGGMPVC